MTTEHVRTAPALAFSWRITAVGLLASVLALLATPAAASAQTTERVSVASDGTQGNFPSYAGAIIAGGQAISADGHIVAFYSEATNLVPGDTNGRWVWDVFVHDRGGPSPPR